MGRRSYSGNAVPTVLSGGIGAADLSFNVQNATGYPTGGASGPFYVTLARGAADEEKILCDSRSGLTFTVNAAGRGADGTVATSHAATSTTVEHTISKADLDEANAHVNDTTGDPHPQYLTSAEGDALFLTQAEGDALYAAAGKLMTHHQLFGPIPHTGSAWTQGATVGYEWPGAALSASTVWFPFDRVTWREAAAVRWQLVWTPNDASNGIRLVHLDPGPLNITQLAEFTGSASGSPIHQTIEITAAFNALIAGGVEKYIGNQITATATGPTLYSSRLEILWA